MKEESLGSLSLPFSIGYSQVTDPGAGGIQQANLYVIQVKSRAVDLDEQPNIQQEKGAIKDARVKQNRIGKKIMGSYNLAGYM